MHACISLAHFCLCDCPLCYFLMGCDVILHHPHYFLIQLSAVAPIQVCQGSSMCPPPHPITFLLISPLRTGPFVVVFCVLVGEPIPLMTSSSSSTHHRTLPSAKFVGLVNCAYHILVSLHVSPSHPLSSLTSLPSLPVVCCLLLLLLSGCYYLVVVVVVVVAAVLRVLC